jgi:peptidylamidoglycolate lyase
MKINRRNFTKMATATSAATLMFPNILFGAKEDDVIIGHGKYKYKIVKGWGADNFANNPVNDCHEMVQDKNKRLIFCTNEVKNNIIILDKSGKYISSWGHDYPGAHGLTLSNENGEEFLFLTDTNKGEIYKLTLDGKEVLKLSYPSESGVYNDKDKVKFSPTETAIAPNGDIYVADGYGSSYILVYDSKGKFKNIFGGNTGKTEGLVQAHGVCIDTRDKANLKVIATSRSENKFKIYGLDGKYESTYDFPGSYVCRAVIRNKDLYFPVIISRPDQNVKDDWNSKSGFVLVLDKNNKIISAPGANEFVYEGNIPKRMIQADNVKGIIKHCHDVCIDDEDSIYIPQWNSDKGYPVKLQRV